MIKFVGTTGETILARCKRLAFSISSIREVTCTPSHLKFHNESSIKIFSTLKLDVGKRRSLTVSNIFKSL
jgi:hypothetical protein